MLITVLYQQCAEAEHTSPDPALTAALQGAQRSAAFMARDKVRHPAQELAFFGLRLDMSVVEIWPGGGYWTELLAPVLHDNGRYEVAIEPPHDPATGFSATPFARKLAAKPAIYGNVKVDVFGKGHTAVAAPDSVDLIVSFRDVHNWMPTVMPPPCSRRYPKPLSMVAPWASRSIAVTEAWCRILAPPMAT